MSAIFGIVRFDGRPVGEPELERMRECMAHRGPDGGGIWLQGSAGLGQLMLHSTPESLHERLPWQDPDSGLVITADARIDNREELSTKLETSALKPQASDPAGHQGSGQGGGGATVRATPGSASPITDSQMILESFKRWGEACIDHLLGDFAFAIWDPRRRRLFCARDHMGERAFYYRGQGDVLVFGSTAEAVAMAAGEAVRLSESRIADYLVFNLEGIDTECTFFEGVRRMPPAHVAVGSDRAFEPVRYWRPDPESELRLGSDAAYAEAMEEVLTRAVRCRLRSHQPPASMLSGGIDSSTVVGLARPMLDGPLRTYSAGSPEGEDCRETRNIRSVIALGGLRPRLLKPGDLGAWRVALESAMSRVEDPFDYHNVLLGLMYAAARADGAAAVLDGLDGDTVASLTSLYPEYLVRSGHWLYAARELRGIGDRDNLGAWARLRLAFNAVKPSLAPDAYWRRRWNRYVRRSARAESAACWFAAGLERRVDLEGRLRRFYESSGILHAPSLRHAHVRLVSAPYLTAGIERYARLAACFGVEHRQPLLDKRFVEFCVALPWDQKVRDGWSKHCLRRVAAGMAPHAVAWRRGWDQLGWKFERAWFELQRPGLMELYEKSKSTLVPWLDLEAFESSLRKTNASGDDGEKARSVFNLVQWLASSPGRQPS